MRARLTLAVVASVALLTTTALPAHADDNWMDVKTDTKKGQVNGIIGKTTNDEPNGGQQGQSTGSGGSSATMKDDTSMTIYEMCMLLAKRGGTSTADCGTPTTPPPPPSAAQIRQVASTTLQLPIPTPVIEPAPSRNQWDMVAVGYPLWLHLEGPTTMTASAAITGYSIQITATRGRTVFNMGDGNQVACTRTTPWDLNHVGQESPTCGYTYLKRSLPDGNYQVTATTTWTITWTGAGQTGTFTMTRQGATSLPVGELQAVVVGR